MAERGRSLTKCYNYNHYEHYLTNLPDRAPEEDEAPMVIGTSLGDNTLDTGSMEAMLDAMDLDN